jgi:hypothetical protein
MPQPFVWPDPHSPVLFLIASLHPTDDG